MNYHDAICAADFDGGEPEPLDICIECGADIMIGFLRCTACEEAHEEQEIRETDPRRI